MKIWHIMKSDENAASNLHFYIIINSSFFSLFFHFTWVNNLKFKFSIFHFAKRFFTCHADCQLLMDLGSHAAITSRSLVRWHMLRCSHNTFVRNINLSPTFNKNLNFTYKIIFFARVIKNYPHLKSIFL